MADHDLSRQFRYFLRRIALAPQRKVFHLAGRFSFYHISIGFPVSGTDTQLNGDP
jgi:hypothetical protein